MYNPKLALDIDSIKVTPLEGVKSEVTCKDMTGQEHVGWVYYPLNNQEEALQFAEGLLKTDHEVSLMGLPEDDEDYYCDYEPDAEGIALSQAYTNLEAMYGC